MISMTGFGRASIEQERQKVEIEIRSWNHKGTDVQIRLPGIYAHLENDIKTAVSKRAGRGKIHVSISVQGSSSDRDISINSELLGNVISSIKKVADQNDLALTLSPKDIFAVPGAVEIKEASNDEIEDIIHSCVKNALEEWDASRRQEGASLATAILEEWEALKAAVNEIETEAPNALEKRRESLVAKVKELTTRADVDPDSTRMELEIAILAEKSDICEEIVRLRAHLEKLHEIATGKNSPDEKPMGAELNFLMQELLREANTVGSKIHELKIVQAVLNSKKAIDRIREQCANVV
ncbi:MAG: YicC family protein [Candidatus Lindowbacteria bacterium]|nr:YicC family protein [Candidatus Lindowbacteria bacterium]